jgi:hypothetical protein
MSDAFLTMNTGAKGRAQTFNIVVTTYSRGYDMTLAQATVRSAKHYYPIRVKEKDFQFTVQCVSEEQYDQLKTAIHKAQLLAMNQFASGVIRFTMPDMKLDYLGFITSVPEGIRRFDITPTLNLTMSLTKDTINTQTAQYSSEGAGSWKDIYGQTITDLLDSSNTDISDSISEEKPPNGKRPNALTPFTTNDHGPGGVIAFPSK